MKKSRRQKTQIRKLLIEKILRYGVCIYVFKSSEKVVPVCKTGVGGGGSVRGVLMFRSSPPTR